MINNQNSFQGKNKKIELLKSTATLFFPKNCDIEHKDSNTLEVSFFKEKYPVLGIHIQCFDNPKLNTEHRIKEYLIDDAQLNFKLERKKNNFYLNYEIKVENEKLVIYKVLSFLKPRTFRLMRFALTWPDSKGVKKIIDPILETLSVIVSSVNFSTSRTVYDELASLDYKLSSSRLLNYDFWNAIKLEIPSKWKVEHSKDKDFANIFMDSKDNFYFLIERFFINLNKNSTSKQNNNDKLVENLIKEITKEVNITNAKFKKSEDNNYLFYFVATEQDPKDSTDIIRNKIWYRIKVLEEKILIISFVFELASNIEIKNQIYLEKLNQIIDSSEILA